MKASSGNLLTLLGGRDPIGLVFYRDDEAREDLVGLCEVLARACDRTVRLTANVEEAFLPRTREELLAIVSTNEAEAVRILDGRREELLERNVPAILFLMQGGSAEEVLHQEAFALSSFLRGLTYDPERKVETEELDEQRTAFAGKTGKSPEGWLEGWHGGELADTEENNFTAHEAWALRKQ